MISEPKIQTSEILCKRKNIQFHYLKKIITINVFSSQYQMGQLNYPAIAAQKRNKKLRVKLSF